MIRVAVVAAAPAVRAGLRVVLEADPALMVVGEAAPGIDGEHISIDDAEVVVAYRLLPDWLHTLTATLRGLLLLSDDRSAIESLSSTPIAWGLLPEDAMPAEISAAVMALSQGLIVLHPHVASQLFTSPDSIIDVSGHESLAESLTSREREVLQWLGQGLSNRQIAGRLGISEHTVKFHVSAIYAKLGVASRAEAVRVGARRGLLVL